MAVSHPSAQSPRLFVYQLDFCRELLSSCCPSSSLPNTPSFQPLPRRVAFQRSSLDFILSPLEHLQFFPIPSRKSLWCGLQGLPQLFFRHLAFSHPQPHCSAAASFPPGSREGLLLSDLYAFVEVSLSFWNPPPPPPPPSPARHLPGKFPPIHQGLVQMPPALRNTSLFLF